MLVKFMSALSALSLAILPVATNSSNDPNLVIDKEVFENEFHSDVNLEIDGDRVSVTVHLHDELTPELYCYPASSCGSNTPTDEYGLAIGQSKIEYRYYNRSEVKKLLMDIGQLNNLNKFASLIGSRFGGAPGKLITTALGKFNIQMAKEYNARIQSIADNASYRGVIFKAYIGRTYSGYTVNIEFFPWHY